MVEGSWTKPLTDDEQATMLKMAAIQVGNAPKAQQKGGLEHVGSMKATSAALCNRLLDRLEDTNNAGEEDLSRLADILANVVRDVKVVNAWKSSKQQAMTRADIEVDADDDAVPTLLRAAALVATPPAGGGLSADPSGHVDEVVAQALEQLAVCVHGDKALRSQFLPHQKEEEKEDVDANETSNEGGSGGALALLVRYASGSPHARVRCAAAAGVANLFTLKAAADDAAFRAALLRRRPAVLRALLRLARDSDTLADAAAAEVKADADASSIFASATTTTTSSTASSAVGGGSGPGPGLGSRIEGADRMGYGGKASLPLATAAGAGVAESGKEGPGGLRVDSVTHAVAKALLHLSTMPVAPPPPPKPPAKGKRPTAAQMKRARAAMAAARAAQKGMVEVTTRFYEDGGLEALSVLAERHCWRGGDSSDSSSDGSRTSSSSTSSLSAALSAQDTTLLSVLAHTLLNLAHCAAAEPRLLKMTVSFARCPSPRVHVPAVGVLCKLARACASSGEEEAEGRRELRRCGAAEALRAFVSPDFAVVEEVVGGKVGGGGRGGAHVGSKIVQHAEQALATLVADAGN